MIVPSQLAQEAERLRFRLAHHLGGDPERLEGLLQQLERRVPHHPVARTARAEAALPETALPGPPPELAGSAEAWLAGDPQAALIAARRALSERDHPRTRTTVGDLCWFLGRGEEALGCWESVRARLGPLPALLVRLGRAALKGGRAGEALERAVQALLANPLHGTATILLGHAHRARGREVLPVPLPPQVAQVDGELRLARGLGARSRAAWLAGLEAARAADPGELPPGATAVQVLLATWRALPEGDRKEQRASWPLQALERWERDRVLETYLWAVGLSAETAHGFRARRDRAAERDRRFWTEGVLAPS